MDKIDFTPEYDKKGNLIGRRVTSHYGHEYIIGKKLGAGGVAKVFYATRVGDNKKYVFKEYVTKPAQRLIHAAIKSNLIELIKKPLVDAQGNMLAHFVPPLDIVNLSTGFGYIMDLVDTSAYNYKSVVKIINHHEFYPDAKVLCKFCKDFANFFKTIHLKGWCYKDINEGNIYIDPKTGDFWVIDCDNISVKAKKTILGTAGYMAPEVYQTETPDTKSDYFSIAALFFRLMIGSYPMNGPACEKYMLKHEQTADAAAPVIYGTNALFAFHPTDKRNAVYLDATNEKYKIQTRKWNALPKQIKRCMIQTFVTALPYDRCQLRTNDVQWIQCFEDLEKNHLVQCKKCGKYNFDNRKTCYCCGKPLPVPTGRSIPPVPKPQRTTKTTTMPKTTAKPKYEVVFEYLRVVNGKKEKGRFAFDLEEKVAGNRLHPDFSSVPMLYTHYREKEKMYTIKNYGPLTWELARDGKTAAQPKGAEVQINSGLVIKVDKTKCLLKVLGLREKKQSK